MNLNGKWTAKIIGERNIDNIEATVPGCIHKDLINAGLLPDLFYRMNNDESQWVEGCDVTFSRTFELDEVEENTVINFSCLDTYCDIYLNGQKIGEADDMFIPYSFSVDGILKKGENKLEVRFRSPIREVDGLPKLDGAFTTERLYTRRVQCTYGWDWVGRFVTMGISGDVTLETLRPDRFDNIYVYTDSINGYCAKIVAKAAFKDITGESFVNFSLYSPDGERLISRSRRISSRANGDKGTVIAEIIDLKNPKLWWPIGYGDQPLYTLVLDIDGKTVSETVFGIRTAEIIEIEDEDGTPEMAKALECKEHVTQKFWDKNEKSASFILLINGVRIFCPGANWVPSEPFMSDENAEKFEKLIALAREGNFRMLRVWGGGIFEPDEFYALCDKYGILVTQDFLMACGSYPENCDWFIDKLKLEARSAALRLRNHPCLVWWTGDNENAAFGDDNQKNYRGRRSALEGIQPALSELDPKRRFLPSSPYGGSLYACGTRGTSHVTMYLEHIFKYISDGDFSDYRRFFDGFLTRFCAEQPAMGMPYLSSLRNFMTDEDIFGSDTTVSEYHTKSNPALEYSLYEYVDMAAKGIFGEYADGADRLRKMQYLQCERIRLSIELYRRNAWYSSGILYWMYNDCWPAANSWSLVDYYSSPKPAFYSFKRGAKETVLSLTEEKGEYRAYVCHSGRNETKGAWRLYAYNVASGNETDISFGEYSALNESKLLFSANKEELDKIIDGKTVLILDSVSDRAFLLPNGYKNLPWGEEKYGIVEEDEKTVTVKAETTVYCTLLDTEYRLSDNSFFMKRGETRVLEKI